MTTKNNVADDGTKWVKPPKLDKNDRWFSGPAFLHLDEAQWPEDVKDISESSEELVNLQATESTIIDYTRFSKWKKLLRTMAYVVRFISNTRTNINCQVKQKGILTSEELQQAETVVLKSAQQDAYNSDIRHIRKQSAMELHGLQATVDRTNLYMDYHLTLMKRVY